MIISLKAGGVGINLISASAVILMDSWWNPAVIEQVHDALLFNMYIHCYNIHLL